MAKKRKKKTSTSDLTLKQRKWLKVYLECGNATEAAMQSYDCKDRNSASLIGYENIRKLNYEDFLEEAGITDNLLRNRILEGLDANKQLATRVIFKKEAPTSQSAGELPLAGSSTDDFIEVPDHIARHKYLETALKLKQRLLDRKDITSKGEKLESIQVVITEDKPIEEDEQ